MQKAGELRHWRSGGSKLFLESNWFYTHNLLKNPLAFHHLWTLDKFGRLTAVIKQYENMKRGKREVLRTGLVREKKYELKLFETINWKVPAKNGYAVVRFTPNLIEQKVSRKLSQFPVMGESMMISDNRGNLWADYVTVNGEFVGIRTHQGTLYLSYRPFDGAKEVGTVSGSEMLLNFDKKLRLKIRSKGEFIPGGLEAPVYAFIKNKERSESPHSVRTSVADSATEVIDRLKLHN